MSQTSSNSNNWFVCPKTNPKAEMRLFMFPYAGGSPAAFWKWANEFPDFIETRIIHYPGRGSRFNETPIKQINILVDKLYLAIQPYLDKPFVFFGHSLGALIAFELARILHHNNLPQPNILFVSACGAPQLPNPQATIHALPDAEFQKALQDLNGTPAGILDHPELMELLLPTLRADFEAFENYQYTSNTRPLDCSIITFGGENDPRLSRDQLSAWTVQTSSTFEAKYFPGGHFFINSTREAVIHSIVEEILLSATKESR